eukprot:TRINITY_DN18492_c0_g1_i2.p1 TRINITY_DN18492_c0_g1~~TRINITY_DN18492_c0_g1_i2.p1  ORF type:complete len:301 (-),score=59.40 TRINITY_DN18492_c0_g1_i2:165-1067(-)
MLRSLVGSEMCIRDRFYSCCFTLTALVGQAVGVGNPAQAGNWTMLCLMIVMSISGLNSVYFYYGTHYTVEHLSPEPDVVTMATEFNRVYWLGTVFLALNLVLRQYANGLSESTGPMIGAMTTIGLNLCFNQWLIYGIDGWFHGLGFIGSAWATTCALGSQLVIFCAYSFGYKQIHREKRAWAGFDWSAFRADRIMTFIALAFPATIGAMTEKMGVMSLSFLSPRLGNKATDCMMILFNLQVLSSSAFLGCGVALQVRVANHIGKGDIHAAKMTIFLTTAIMLVCGAVSYTHLTLPTKRIV